MLRVCNPPAGSQELEGTGEMTDAAVSSILAPDIYVGQFTASHLQLQPPSEESSGCLLCALVMQE